MEVGGSVVLRVWVRCPGAAGVGGEGAEVDTRLGRVPARAGPAEAALRERPSAPLGPVGLRCSCRWSFGLRHWYFWKLSAGLEEHFFGGGVLGED